MHHSVVLQLSYNKKTNASSTRKQNSSSIEHPIANQRLNCLTATSTGSCEVIVQLRAHSFLSPSVRCLFLCACERFCLCACVWCVVPLALRAQAGPDVLGEDLLDLERAEHAISVHAFCNNCFCCCRVSFTTNNFAFRMLVGPLTSRRLRRRRRNLRGRWLAPFMIFVRSLSKKVRTSERGSSS